ncbi:MAG: hypothetical protein N3A54_04875 [Patescibacteria group bacterium]|nr:hypothetical protein [Patescibacteria group bacterium]
MKYTTTLKKILAYILISIVMFWNVSGVLGQEAPMAPTPPEIPAAPTPPGSLTTVPPSPQAPSAPTSPSTPTYTNPSPTSEPQPTPRERKNRNNNASESSESSEQSSVSNNPTPTQTPQHQSNQNQGETRIITGDATNQSLIVTTGNTNRSEQSSNQQGNASITTTGNGGNSQNDTSVKISDESLTTQQNSAVVNTNLDQNTTTGNNTSSGNVGDTYIKTGNANVSGTVITSLNTNVDGVVIAEFNIADDHRGDIVLDFASACVSGCGTQGTSVTTQGNGANSSNTTNIQNTSTDVAFQNNDATIGNTLTLNANSGNNQANYNTGGESVIYTGDANVSANLLTFANNNIQGNVVYGVVNIYGDLIGDIIFPEEQFAAFCCTSSTSTVTTANNGANSTNTTTIANSTNATTFQNNDAVIENILVLDAQTGNNTVTGNTSGDNRVITGNSNIDANVINVANSNIDGGNMWLVIINEAGKWIGKIFGGNGSNMAASDGLTLTTDAQGNVMATNGNGANSTNTTTIDTTSTTTTIQNNQANIQNTLNLSANTGGNQASYNTGGNSSVVTGDANIIANMVNFVNNNITGTGKLFVTVVNVFGSWIGDFILPGHKKEAKNIVAESTQQDQNTAIGGTHVLIDAEKSQEQRTVNNTGNTIKQSSASETNEHHAWPKNQQEKVKTIRTNIVSQPNDQSVIQQTEDSIELTEISDYPDATITPIVAGKRVIRVNLAWLIFIIPSGIILFVILKKATRKS